MEGAPARGVAKAWLDLGVRLGKLAAVCLVVRNFLAILAPLFFLLDLGSTVNASQAGGELVTQASDPGLFLGLADLVGILGHVLLAAAFGLWFAGIEWMPRPPRLRVMALGATAFACLAAIPLAMAWVGGRPRWTAGGSLAGAATLGGWGVEAVTLLAGVLAYVMFVLLLPPVGGNGRLISRAWIAFACVNVVGAGPLAALIEGAGEADRNPYAVTIALAVRILLVPALGAIAYREVFDKAGEWARGLSSGTPRARRAALTAPIGPAPRPRRAALPPPPED